MTGKMPKYPARPGAPTKLTPEIIKTICNALLIGNYFETACAVAGIHKDSAYAWLKLATKNPKSIHKQFSDAVSVAQANAESRDLAVIEITAHGTKAQYDENGHLVRAEVQRDWRAAAWRLERKHPKKWGRLDRHEITGKDAGPLTFVDLIRDLEREKAESEKK